MSASGGKRTLPNVQLSSYHPGMSIRELVSQLVGVAPDSADPAVDWNLRGKLWTRLEREAQETLRKTCPEAWCTAQEWDDRIDCSIRSKNGGIVGEMISLSDVTAARLTETASRLHRSSMGEHVDLIDPILPPVFIGKGSANDR